MENQADLIRNFMTNMSKTGKDKQTKGFIQGRRLLLDKYWLKFEQYIDEVLENPDESASTTSAKLQKLHAEIECIYTDVLGILIDLESGFAGPAPAINAELRQPVCDIDHRRPAGIKLPAIVIPKFSGDFSTWTSFHDLFDSLVVKNPSLSKVNKLHHLKSSLCGEAELVLRQFAIEENNFDPAWELLQRRFANKRMIVNAQVKKFLSQPKISGPNADSVRLILDVSTECINSIKNLLAAEERLDTFLVYVMSQKLDIKTLELWEQSVAAQDEHITFEQFSRFLENHCRTLDLVQSAVKASDFRAVVKPDHSKRSITQSYHASAAKTSCALCNKDNHAIYQCFKYRRMPLQERQHVVKSKQLCERCLSHQHKTFACTSSYKCIKCDKPHHLLLHSSSDTSRQTSSNVSTVDPTPPTTSSVVNPFTTSAVVHSHHASSLSYTKTLLATAKVSIMSSYGKLFTLRALVDPGSQSCMITRSAATLLRLKMHTRHITVKGLGSSVAGQSQHIVQCTVSAVHDPTSSISFQAVVMSHLTENLPTSFVPHHNWAHLDHLQLADPGFHTPEKIDLILGADVYGDLILPEIKKGPIGTPTAQKTSLGWILIGKLFESSTPSFENVESQEIVSCFGEVQIGEQLKRFWELEELPTFSSLKGDDSICERHFQSTHTRRSDGRYSVELPFRTHQSSPDFGNSKRQALSRLWQVERRLKANPHLKSQYDAFMDEYLRLGHMKPSAPGDSSKSFYLPHHAIVKPSSLSTKLRVVFDASARDTNGTSLNDTLLIGPTIQQDLISILLRWRTYKYAVTADVEKMYRQIGVTQKHQPYQRILWRNETNVVQEYELTTVTYGTACAPYLAIRTIQQLADDEQHQYPLACERTRQDMYVDDLISGGGTVCETQKLQREMVQLFSKGGFNLRKWASNSTEILDSIPTDKRETTTHLDICHDDIIKTLGVLWNTVVDQFHFTVTLSEKSMLTKRTLLSEVAKLFDPLGFLAPIIITAKILLQSLWLRGLGWDDLLPTDIVQEWLKLRSHLSAVSKITIPRWIGMSTSTVSTEFHGFCDSSIKAYAAVIYCRTVDESGIVCVQLITSKTRVAPIKKVSLPNLELCGATLLAQLMTKVSVAMRSDAHKFAWTDSTIVLDWLQSNKHKQTFVANRISTILDHLEPSQWRHIRSNDNPADVASRGICPSKLAEHSQWWNGPSWLSLSSDFWPSFRPKQQLNPEAETFVASATLTSDDLIPTIEKCSSLSKLLRIIAYCCRFANNCRKPRSDSFLSAEELRDARNRIIKYVQSVVYSSEIRSLQKDGSLGSSKISSLCPFICDAGLLRVGGRLRNSNMNYDHKYPILLPKDSHLTKLIISKTHLDTLHGGPKLTLSTIRSQYWIPNARNTIRAFIHACVICHRFSVRRSQQLMSALPIPRVTRSKVFAHTGVDYAGPFNLRLSKHRGRGTYKGFISVFVCMATKAIHLELSSDLTANTFIATFKRFISRRGQCTDIYSDNGTNFVGADKQLQTQFDATMQQINSSAAEHLANHGTQWHFIPPSSPHFGGLWEAGVKSVKYHLKRIIKDTLMTYEEFSTLLSQIEAALNSRPLCPLSSDPNDLQALTPGHFLVGSALIAVPEPSLLDVAENRLSRWQFVEKIHQDFWNAWSRDYLSELQQRPKGWKTQRENPKVGDLVLVKDDRLPPNNWPLARITTIHPGQDGIVRVVSLKHKGGEMKRPVAKLSKLPIDTDNKPTFSS